MTEDRRNAIAACVEEIEAMRIRLEWSKRKWYRHLCVSSNTYYRIISGKQPNGAPHLLMRALVFQGENAGSRLEMIQRALPVIGEGKEA